MYRGSSKCPGCGQTGYDSPRENKDSLCLGCKRIYKIGKNVEDYYNLSRTWYVIPDHKQMYLTWYTIRIKAIDYALDELLRSVSVFDKEFCSRAADWRDSLLTGRLDPLISRVTYSLPEPCIDAAKNLCDVVRQVCNDLEEKENNYKKELEYSFKQIEDEVFKKGIKEGTNLLFSLNRGEITQEEINKRII